METNANLILDRIKTALSIKTDTQLAGIIGVKPNSLSTWRSRNSIDYNLIFTVCDQYNLDLNQVILGKGHERSISNGDTETFEISMYSSTTQSLLKKNPDLLKYAKEYHSAVMKQVNVNHPSIEKLGSKITALSFETELHSHILQLLMDRQMEANVASQIERMKTTINELKNNKSA